MDVEVDDSAQDRNYQTSSYSSLITTISLMFGITEVPDVLSFSL